MHNMFVDDFSSNEYGWYFIVKEWFFQLTTKGDYQVAIDFEVVITY